MPKSLGRGDTEALNENAPVITGAFSSAETEGFEPSVPQGELHLSRVVHSAGLCDVSWREAKLPSVANYTYITSRQETKVR